MIKVMVYKLKKLQKLKDSCSFFLISYIMPMLALFLIPSNGASEKSKQRVPFCIRGMGFEILWQCV
jgi:hypothetical protein